MIKQTRLVLYDDNSNRYTFRDNEKLQYTKDFLCNLWKYSNSNHHVLLLLVDPDVEKILDNHSDTKYIKKYKKRKRSS
jgi:hypothetical protein